ncbi:hypothetical protein Phum_PHUM537440 [Pediculus humanus corporis]|uniref:C2H2-type domain-containing protein n=1 Tax=Pediculus humanus subsp. corporis TaxID=121224 RepID=E0VZR6_PEDHC|nr:uncharacterized protein Phum_PHUM537440 [Pediculus humanus corporis]EEB18872.1 hypothetical protein Phum_PHUM537440 [Pediculus humanus corporis]
MDSCLTNHQLLPDNYVVQPVESIPVSLIDYDKIDMIIHSDHLTNDTPEIQRDFELRQRQAVSKDFTPTIENSTDQLSQKCKRISASNSFFDGVMQLNSIPNGKNSVFNINTPKTPENVICQISPSGQQMTLEKKQYIILSDNSSVFNITSKDEEFVDKSVNNEIIKYGNSEEKSNLEPAPVIIHNSIISSNNNNRNNGKIIESDSENDDEDIEPVNDYEPDPDTHTVLVSSEHLEKPNKCYVCFRSFRQKKNMYAHIRKIHSTQPKIEGGILCPLCKMHALRQEHLRNHLESLHKISIEKEEKLFNTMEGATCPAAMEVTENVNGINVTFWKTHVGHDNDISHVLFLSKDKKDKISPSAITEQLSTGIILNKTNDNNNKKINNNRKNDVQKNSPEIFFNRKKNLQGRKPVKEKMLRRASQSLVIEKAGLLLNLLETTDVRPEFRPKICLMIDNLISTVKRRTGKGCSKRENIVKKCQM